MERVAANAKIVKRGERYAFVIETGSGIPVFRSEKPHPVFVGEYGTYSSPKTAMMAASEMVRRNVSVVAALADLVDMDEIKAELVDKYRNFYEFCSELYADILADSDNETYNELHVTVPTLDKMLDDAAGPGKQIDMLVNEIEKSTTEDLESEELEEDPDLENVSNEASVELLTVRDMMRELQGLLKEKFPAFINIQRAASAGAKKYAGSQEMAVLAAEMVVHYAKAAAAASGMGELTFDDISESDGCCIVTFRERNGDRRACVITGDDLTFRGIYPLNGISVMSYDHFEDMIRPSMSAIGHWKPLGSSMVVLPRTPPGCETNSDRHCFEAFPTDGSRRRMMMTAEPRGGKRTRCRSCDMKFCPFREASYAARMKDALISNAKDIAESALVKVVRPGSKYEGMAGTVDPAQIVVRNDHIEFPVMLEYETGLETEVWLTDDDVEVYLGRP